MAVITGIFAGDMCRMLANGSDAVVAGTASADHLGVIDSHRRCKDVGRVAIVTGV